MSADRKYWRSLEQIADDPRARAFLEREFPEHASEAPEGVTRRTMLSLLGASLSLAGFSGCRRPVERIVPYVNAPPEALPGIPRRYATTMPFGNGAYGLVVESHEGRPTKIEGNELHPSTAGASSAWIQAAMLGLYDPDRSRTVLHDGQPADWSAFVEALGAVSGEGLAVLSEPFSSPTRARLARAVRERLPEVRWATWEPVSDENAHAGIRAVFGQQLQPVYHFDRADVVLSLDADFMLTESEAVRHARGFAQARRVASTSDSMSRLYAVETALSLTGGNADHRLRLRSGEIAAFAARVAAEPMRQAGFALPPRADALSEEAAGFASMVARDLMAHRGGRSLVVAGRGQPPEVHALAHALNVALQNVDATVTYHVPRDTERSRRSDLEDLVGAMRAGSVRTLVILGGNPVYDAPADLEFSTALEKVPQVVHLSPHVDETSARASWHVPRAHFLESWSDARAADGTPSVVQPLIEPLFGGHGAVELLTLLAGGEPRTAYEQVRRTWTKLLTGDFEAAWERVLHDGVHDDARPPVVRPAEIRRETLAVLGSAPASAEGLDLVFRPSPALFDGRFANNGWLQEWPDPVTKLTWDNAAMVSPATAARLGLANEDVARLSSEGREIELPVWIVPGQADDTVVLYLGYGRRAAGRVGNGRGVDVYALRTSSRPDVRGGATLEPTGATYPLAPTQDHGRMEGRPIVREATLEEFRHEPKFAQEMVEHPPLVSMWEEHAYDTGHQWGMSIDLTACNGCSACVIACQSENNIPIVGKEQVIEGREMQWLRVDRYFEGSEEDPQVVFQPVPCMHCENAPCEQVCPVAATVHDSEGLNTMVYNRCIGTRYCSNNCPYKVRRFNFFNFTKDTPEVQKLANNPDVTVRSRGVMEKCTYCVQRINAGKIDAKLHGRPLRDGEIRTACEQACPTGAIVFGDLRDPQSRVARAKASDLDYTMLAELNNKPRTSYQAKLRNPIAEGETG